MGMHLLRRMLGILIIMNVLGSMPASAASRATDILQSVKDNQSYLLENYELKLRLWTIADEPVKYSVHRVIFGNRVRIEIEGSWSTNPNFHACRVGDGEMLFLWNTIGSDRTGGSIRRQAQEHLANDTFQASWLFGLVENDQDYLWNMMLQNPEDLKVGADGDATEVEITLHDGEDISRLILDPKDNYRIKGLSYKRVTEDLSGAKEVVEGRARIESYERIGNYMVPQKGQLKIDVQVSGQSYSSPIHQAEVEEFTLLTEAPPASMFNMQWPVHCSVTDRSGGGEDDTTFPGYMADAAGRLVAYTSLVPTHPSAVSTEGLSEEEKQRLVRELSALSQWVEKDSPEEKAALQAAEALKQGHEIMDFSAVPPFGARLLQMIGHDVDPEIKFHALNRTPPEIAEKRIAAIGQPAPPLEAQQWYNSKPLELMQLKGKIVYLAFFSRWCGPCKAEYPKLIEIQNRSVGNDLELIGVLAPEEDKEELGRFVKEYGLNFPVAVDAVASAPFGETSARYGVTGVPHGIVIDRDGKMVYSGDSWRAQQKIQELLKSEGAPGAR